MWSLILFTIYWLNQLFINILNIFQLCNNSDLHLRSSLAALAVIVIPFLQSALLLSAILLCVCVCWCCCSWWSVLLASLWLSKWRTGHAKVNTKCVNTKTRIYVYVYISTYILCEISVYGVSYPSLAAALEHPTACCHCNYHCDTKYLLFA